jgi:hypothetical protein
MRPAYLFATILAAAIAASATDAQAQYPWGFGGYDGPAWFGPYRNLYGTARVPVPPYYALHPPVYYSHPVARPYGTSPFACPCTHTEAVAQPQAEVIENPFVPKPAEAEEKGASQQTARVIWNPFYKEGAQLVRLKD